MFLHVISLTRAKEKLQLPRSYKMAGAHVITVICLTATREVDLLSSANSLSR